MSLRYHTLDRKGGLVLAQVQESETFVNPWLEEKVRQGFEPNVNAPKGSSDNPSNQVLTVANVITGIRLVLTCVFLYMFVARIDRVLAITIYALAASTDWMDGQIARRTQTVSWFGKLLDPVCDRFLLFTGVLGLVLTEELPAWVAFFVIGRDVYLAIGSLVVRHYRERPVDVVYIGKVATALLMFGFCDLLLGVPVVRGLDVASVPWLPGLDGSPVPLGLFFVYAGCVCSAITAVVYTIEGVTICRAAVALGRNRS